MALKVHDGFDHYKAQGDLQSRVGALQWSDINANGAFTLVAGRGGYGQAVLVGNATATHNNWFGGSFPANYSTAFVGVALLFGTGGTSFLIQAMDYTAQLPQLTCQCFFESGTIIVYAGDVGGTVIASSPPNAFSPYIWNYWELGVTIGTAGSFDLHCNGTSVLSAGLTGGGVRTQNPADSNSFFNGIKYSAATNGVPNYFLADMTIDDFYLCDNTAGPGTFPCNTFLGDSAVRTQFPTANASVQWTPIANTNWQEVGETQFDGDTSYNYATAVGDADLYSFGSLPTNVSAVYGVQITGGYRKLDAGAQTIVQKMVSGGTTSAGATLTLSLSYGFYTDMFVLDPHTGASWAPAAVDALSAGMTLNS
jgi:hypothetical protein